MSKLKTAEAMNSEVCGSIKLPTRNNKLQDEIAIVHARQSQYIERKHVDATPNDEYPIRILEAYLEDTKYMWSTSTSEKGEKELPEIMKIMNKWNKERAKILKKAISILKLEMTKNAN